jgi:hypothetical protein
VNQQPTTDTEKDQTTMPRVKFSAKDMLRGKVVEPAWYVVHIDNVGEAPSKDGGSTNYPVEATIVCNADTRDTKFAGVPLEWNFNSKAIGFATGFLASFGVEVQEDKFYDLANATGRDLEVFVETGEWQGRMKNQVNHKYRPLRTA